MYGKVGKSTSSSTSFDQSFELRNTSSSSAMGSLKAIHQNLTPLTTYLVLYLFFSAQVFPRSSGAQKFYPNGRYGKRAQLPQMMKVPSSLMASVDAYLNNPANGNNFNKDIMTTNFVNPLEEYQPMWCTEVERKLNLFKCFDRFPVKQMHGQTLEKDAAMQQAIPSEPSADQS